MYLNAIMKFDNSVSTILFCYKCCRNVMITSSNTWTNRVVNKPVDKPWMYFTLVYCHSCITDGMGAFANMLLPVDASSIPTPAYGVIESLKLLSSVDVLIHTICTANPNRDVSVLPYMMPGEFAYEIKDVYKVMSGITNKYMIMSVYQNSVVEPYDDFIMGWTPVMMKTELKYAQMSVNNIMVCPMCRRNNIFTGSCSVTDLSDFTVRGSCLNLIMYTCCDTCNRSGAYANKDVLSVLDMDVEWCVKMVKRVSVYLGTDVYIYKNPESSEAKVVDVHEVAQRLAFTAKRWSLVGSVCMPAHIDFI